MRLLNALYLDVHLLLDAAGLLRSSSFASTQIPGVFTRVVSGFSNGGGLHLRISGFQIRKRYHNH